MRLGRLERQEEIEDNNDDEEIDVCMGRVRSVLSLYDKRLEVKGKKYVRVFFLCSFLSLSLSLSLFLW